MGINHCGTCTACCRVFSIPELKDKKAGEWCQHCTVGVGCKIYPEHPKTCQDFACLWLLSQSRGDAEKLPMEMRPDRSKVVISPSTDHSMIVFTTMPGSPHAWRKPLFEKVIARLIRGGLRMVAGEPGSLRKIVVDKFGEREVAMTPPDQDGIQWNVETTP